MRTKTKEIIMKCRQEAEKRIKFGLPEEFKIDSKEIETMTKSILEKWLKSEISFGWPEEN